ncbi:NADPH-dependent FMN reductase, partial [Escherichia coli]
MGIPAISHPPRILMLYGSVRERSYSRLATEEAGRLLTAMGADVRIFNPSGLPLPDDAPESHPKVMELRELVRWGTVAKLAMRQPFVLFKGLTFQKLCL